MYKTALQVFSFSLLCSSFSLFAQDFSYTTSKVAFSFGEVLGKLESCTAPKETVSVYMKAIDKQKKSTFPDPSYYQEHIALFDESFLTGKESAAQSFKPEKEACKTAISQAKQVIESIESNNN